MKSGYRPPRTPPISTLPLLLAVLAAQACRTLPADPAAARPIPDFLLPEPDPRAEVFYVIGDMGTGQRDQHLVARSMAQRARERPPDFILTVGDNFYPEGVASIRDPQWQEKLEDVYADPALQVPFYPSLGNHDHKGNADAQVDYGRHHPRWRMEGRYYSFDRELRGGDVAHFVAIDSTPLHGPSASRSRQLAWLEQDLAASTARWKIVFGHHPLYSHSKTGVNRLLIEVLEPLFVEYGVDVYFAGHDHVLELLEPVQGVHHVISGAGGGPSKAYEVVWSEEDSVYAATLGGFVLASLTSEQMVLEFVRPDGKTQFGYTIRSRAAAEMTR